MLTEKTWSSPSNTENFGSKVKQSTEGKVKDVEGEVVVDPSRQVERRSGYGKVQGSVKAPVPL